MIRAADRSDIPAIAELTARAFPGERSVADRIRQLETGGTWGGIETAWVAERAGRMVGAFRSYPMLEHMHGAQLRTMGLAAVAVDETARRRGVGREMCEHAVLTARERGDVLSLLYPFRPAFYSALGWGLTGELHAYRFQPESLPLHEGEVRRLAGNGDVASISACYSRVSRDCNGPLVRPPRAWRNYLDADAVHVYGVGRGELAGYMMVRFGRGASPDERPLHIREIVTDDNDAYLALLGWVSQQRDAFRLVQYEATPQEHFMHRLAEPRPPGFHLARNLWAPVHRALRGPMLRVLNVKAALEQRRRWNGAPPLRFGLQVADDVVEANAQPLTVDFDGSAARVSAGAAAPMLRISAPAFAQVYAGELTVRAALQLGTAQCDGDASAINALFRTDRSFRLLDEF